MSTGGGRDRLELVAAVLLAIATVATAWSGYQSTRWNGEQSKAAARTNALRIDSTKAAGLANTQTEVDVATFTQWINAYAQRQTRLTTTLKAACTLFVPMYSHPLKRI